MKEKKNAKHVLNFEKRHLNSGVITQLNTGDNSFVSTDKEILKECENFYKNLYISHVDAQHIEDNNSFFLKNRTENYYIAVKENARVL